MSDFNKVLITGCGRGIGAQVARVLAAQSIELVALNRSREPLEKLIAEIGGNTKITPYYIDLTDLEAVEVTVKQICSEHPDIDVAILNAGLDTPQKIEHFDWRIAKAQIDTNLTSNYIFAAHLIPQMLKRGSGRFVVNSSLASFAACPYEHAYSASKAGARMLVDGLRAELLETAVNVTGIYPGFVATDMVDGNAFQIESILSVDEAARIIVDGLERGDDEIIFPMETYELIKQLVLAPPADRAIIARQQMKDL
ncbi:MAG: SDR family NAD(P)-dependent oxidoreductase [Parahaliea sp.]